MSGYEGFTFGGLPPEHPITNQQAKIAEGVEALFRRLDSIMSGGGEQDSKPTDPAQNDVE